MFPQQLTAKDGRSVTVRRALPADAAQTVKYVNEVSGQTEYLSFGPTDYDRTASEQETRLTKIAAADNQLFLLATIENELAGMIHFGTGKRPRTRHTGDFGMSVHQKYWGLGVGSMLLQCVIEWSQQVGFVRKINLRVRTDNAPAIRLYERKGFKVEGTIARDFQIAGVFFDSYCMGLELDAVREDTG